MPRCSGSLSSISLVTILVRRHFFRSKFLHLVRTDANARKRVEDIEAIQEDKEGRLWHRIKHPSRFLARTSTIRPAEEEEEVPEKPRKKSGKLNVGMIRKVDDEKRMQEVMDNLKEEAATPENGSVHELPTRANRGAAPESPILDRQYVPSPFQNVV
jgi:hypothetical protein